MVLDFYFDVDRKERVVGPTNKAIVAMPVFSQVNTHTFRIRALQPTGDLLTPYTPISNTGKTLQLALGSKGGAQLHQVEQYTWALNPDQNDPYFYADVSFNTAGVVTLLAGQLTAESYLEINLVDGGNPKTLFSQLVTVEASVIQNSSLTVPAGQTPLSLETALALFLQRTIKGPVTLVCETDDTKRRDIFIAPDGTFHADAS